MKSIIVLIFLLPLTTTTAEDILHQCWGQEGGRSNFQLYENTTKHQVKAIFDLIQLFEKSTIEKSYADWILKNSTFEIPSEIINYKNITFTTFIPDEKIFPFSELRNIECKFKRSLTVIFDGNYAQYNIGGNIVEHLRSENSTSCMISFNGTGNIRSSFTIEIISQDVRNKYPKIDLSSYEWRMDKFQVNYAKGESCQKINNETSLRNETFQALKIITDKRLKLIVRSIFQSHYKKCLHLQSEEKTYSHFKVGLYMENFPWNSDYHELMVTGLNNFRELTADYYSYSSFYEGKEKIEIKVQNVRILGDIMSVNTKRFNFDIYLMTIVTLIDGPVDYTKINLANLGEKDNTEYEVGYADDYKSTAMNKLGIENVSNNLMKLVIASWFSKDKDDDGETLYERTKLIILKGIEQTFQKIRYDGTAEFTNIINQIQLPFYGEIFKNGFNNYRKKTLENFYTSFSGIEMEPYSHFDNIICIINDKLVKIGTIIYKNIKGRADFIGSIDGESGNSLVNANANVYLKQVNFNIVLQRDNKMNDVAVQSDDDFNVAETTILFHKLWHKNGNNLSRKDRISVAKLILEDFYQVFRDQIRKIVKSAIRPLIDICTREDSSNSDITPTSNWRQYFAFIRGHWYNATDASSFIRDQGYDTTTASTIQSVDVVINGTWNFKSINLRYVNENLIINSLRMENVTGSMKLWGEKPIVLNYRVRNLLLTIDHNNTNVSVKVPGSLSLLNSLTNFNLDLDEVTEKFVTVVASFIQQSIYGDSIGYHEKYRTLLQETIKEVEGKHMPLKYNSTSESVSNFVRILKNIESKTYHPTGTEKKLSLTEEENYNTEEENNNTAFNGSTYPSQAVFRFGPLIITEEICDNFDSSQNVSSLLEQYNIRGNISMRYWDEDNLISYEVIKHRKINISNSENFGKHLEINIDNKTIKNKNLKSFDENTLNRKLKPTVSNFIEEKNYDTIYEFPPNICRQRFNFIKHSENHFYSISNTVEYASQGLLMYHIKLQGLYNLKSLRCFYSEDNQKLSFEITATNLTAHIVWNFYIENFYFLKVPKEMKLQIDQIVLAGKIFNEVKEIEFTDDDQSRLKFYDHDDRIPTKMKKKIRICNSYFD